MMGLVTFEDDAIVIVENETSKTYRVENCYSILKQ
jgi:hypothetical protein